MLSTHTPGPWWVAKGPTPAVFAGTWPDHDVVCHVNGGFDDQYQQNARLIAAAPDLVEALEEAVLYAEIVAQGDGNRVLALRAWAAVKATRAALAKARGETC
jgi:hypothetical protein